MQLNNKHRINDVSPFGRRFEGYHFADTLNGRSKHVYTGEYYYKCLPEQTAKLQKILYPCLSLISLLLFFLAGSLPVKSNISIVTVLTSCCELLLFLWLAYIMVTLVTRQKKLTVWGYRVTALQLHLCTLGGSLLLLVSAVYTLVYSITNNNGPLVTCIIATVSYFLSCAALAYINISEYRTPYDVEYPT